MILVLEESEEISPELLSPLLASVKRGNEVSIISIIILSSLFFMFSFLFSFCQLLIAFSIFQEVLPVARKLGEKVLESCANKVKPYLQHAVKSLDISLDDYSEIVASICQSGTVEQNDAHAADENKVSF